MLRNKNKIIESLAALQLEFAEQLSELQLDAQKHKDLIIENLEKSGSEFSSQFSELQWNAQQQKFSFGEVRKIRS